MNVQDGHFRVGAAVRFLGEWFYNYNSVEAVLLFSCVLVALGGIMYIASSSSTYYASSTSAITGLLMFIISISIVYCT